MSTNQQSEQAMKSGFNRRTAVTTGQELILGSGSGLLVVCWNRTLLTQGDQQVQHCPRVSKRLQSLLTILYIPYFLIPVLCGFIQTFVTITPIERGDISRRPGEMSCSRDLISKQEDS
jgi:hypothetical protein